MIFNKLGTKQHQYGVKRHENSRTPHHVHPQELRKGYRCRYAAFPSMINGNSSKPSFFCFFQIEHQCFLRIAAVLNQRDL